MDYFQHRLLSRERLILQSIGHTSPTELDNIVPSTFSDEDTIIMKDLFHSLENHIKEEIHQSLHGRFLDIYMEEHLCPKGVFLSSDAWDSHGITGRTYLCKSFYGSAVYHCTLKPSSLTSPWTLCRLQQLFHAFVSVVTEVSQPYQMAQRLMLKQFISSFGRSFTGPVQPLPSYRTLCTQTCGLLFKASAKPVLTSTHTIHVSQTSGVTFNVQNKDDFQDRVVGSESPVIVDFHAQWCGPCKILGTRLEKVVAKQQGKVLMAKVDIDDHTDLALEYREIEGFAWIRHECICCAHGTCYEEWYNY
ncbi:thioredoxin, mitochondrial isoform X2 [Dendrobates tinctorius]|uniref:thioredoxin, mitochondrial isoform X2 n=1 Tax=Dendrobates tinctorius TaxID=92724 RepID=UPI003CC93074